MPDPRHRGRVSDDLTLQSVGLLFGLKEPPRPGETALEARDRELAEEDARVEAAAGAERDERNAEAQARKLASERRSLFDRDSINWTMIGDRWVIGMKKTILVLDHHESGPAGWRVLLMGEDRARVVAKNLDLGYALGAAEHLIREAEVVQLADKDAPWRAGPASKGQRGRLWHLGVKIPPGLTKGDAADLITRTIAEQRLERFDRAIQEAA